MKKKRIAIFASGSGSNAVNILDFFKDSDKIEVGILLTNNSHAGVLEKTKNSVKQVIISNDEANNGRLLSKIMHEHHIEYIILAGYLRKIPGELIEDFPENIINIHPALLPKYGGKGMYGMNVHKAVAEQKEIESGITIHVIDNQYDKGKVLAQYKTPILIEDSPEIIQKKVLTLEHKYFPMTIDNYIRSRIKK